jgi:Family of unknown function (DUF6399)
MTPVQPTSPDQTRQEPFRWGRADVGKAFDAFSEPTAWSQRQYAKEYDIPRSTLGYWLRRDDPAAADPVAAFCHSAAGQSFLKGIVLSALCTFSLEGACGIRLLGTFLQRSGLDRFVGASRGALLPLLNALETHLAAFEDQERPALAEGMPAKTITAAVDEHFHAVKPCLVAIEPVSNFILVECYRDRRDADTWKAALLEGTQGMKVEIVLLTSDLARALICCAEKGLQVAHSPDLFHGQRDLLKPLLLPLSRPLQQAQKDLEKAEKRIATLDCPEGTPQPKQDLLALIESVRHELAITTRLEEAKQRLATAVQEVRGVGDDYHPFDRDTGQPVTAAQVGERLTKHLEGIAEVIREANLGERVAQGLNKTRTWVSTLMGCVAWFWSLVDARVEELELSEAQARQVREKLLPGHYWEMAAGRARTVAERKRLRKLAAALQQEAWQEGGALASLSAEERREVARVAQESAGLFSRSSSCVEGRNGRLSLHHHGHGQVSAARLTALRVIHNYLVKRADGTTAGERFFGQQHKDVFSWLLQRLPDLPRPAAKRPPKADQHSRKPG